MKIELSRWSCRDVINLEEMSSYKIGYGSFKYDLPTVGIDISSVIHSYQIKNGKYRGCVGRLVKVIPAWNTVKLRLSFVDNKEHDLSYNSLRYVNLPNTELDEYTKPPTYVTNAFRQDIEVKDKVIISRNNQVYFGHVKEIRSNTCVVISLYPIRNNARKDIRINNLDGIIR